MILYWIKMALSYGFPFINIRIILTRYQISILSNVYWTVRKEKKLICKPKSMQIRKYSTQIGKTSQKMSS